MKSIDPQQPQSCLSLADGYLGECSLVRQHNASIGARAEELIQVPEELTGEFSKLSASLKMLSRAYESRLVEE